MWTEILWLGFITWTWKNGKTLYRLPSTLKISAILPWLPSLPNRIQLHFVAGKMWSISFVLHIFTPLAPPHYHAPSHQQGSIFLCLTGLGYVSSLDPWNEGKRDDVSVLRLGLKRIGPLVVSDFCHKNYMSRSLPLLQPEPQNKMYGAHLDSTHHLKRSSPAGWPAEAVSDPGVRKHRLESHVTEIRWWHIS